jgi:hypothetical protein
MFPRRAHPNPSTRMRFGIRPGGMNLSLPATDFLTSGLFWSFLALVVLLSLVALGLALVRRETRLARRYVPLHGGYSPVSASRRRPRGQPWTRL